MADITSIDRTSTRALMREAEEALKAVADKYGLKLTMKGASFTNADLNGRFSLAVEGADKTAFERDAKWYGLTADDFHAEFKLGSKTFRITGINTRAPKFAIQVVDVKSGKAYKCPTEAVQKALGRPTDTTPLFLAGAGEGERG